MIYKEKLNIFFTVIITLVVRVECDFLDEINVAIQKLQDTVDKISLENAKTNEKMEKLQSDISFMKDANRKSFENVEKLQADFHQLNKMIQNIERKVDEASDLFRGPSMPMVKLVGGKISREGLVYLKGRDALFVYFQSLFLLVFLSSSLYLSISKSVFISER